MIKRYFTVLLLFLSTYLVHAQNQGAMDSIAAIIQEPKHDTAVCNAYLDWGELIYQVNPDTAMILWQTSYELAQRKLAANPPTTLLKKTYLTSLASAVNNIGYIYMNQGDIPKALEYYNRSCKIYEEIENKEDLAISLNNVGAIYMRQGDFPKAIEYFQMSLNIREEIGDKSGIAESLNSIGHMYGRQGDILNALEYHHGSLKIQEEIGNKKGIGISLSNIGVLYYYQSDNHKAIEYFNKCLKIYEEIDYKIGIANALNNLGSLHKNLKDTTKALECHHRSLKIREEIGDKSGIAESLGNIGYVLAHQGDEAEALVYLHRGLRIQEDISDKRGVAASLNNIGGIELKRESVTTALNYGMRGLKIAREIGSPNLISSNSLLLSKVAKQQGNYQEALEMYELHIQMRDSIKNEETQKATIRQQTKYEFEKTQLIKEQEEKEKTRLESEVMSRRNNLQYSVILIAILVLFGGVLALGFVQASTRMAEGVIFFSFLILFEFLLVLADPYIENWSGGAPGIQLLFNAGIAALIFPLHSLFETKLKKRLAK